jgi:hypothetical protein
MFIKPLTLPVLKHTVQNQEISDSLNSDKKQLLHMHKTTQLRTRGAASMPGANFGIDQNDMVRLRSRKPGWPK